MFVFKRQSSRMDKNNKGTARNFGINTPLISAERITIKKHLLALREIIIIYN